VLLDTARSSVEPRRPGSHPLDVTGCCWWIRLTEVGHYFFSGTSRPTDGGDEHPLALTRGWEDAKDHFDRLCVGRVNVI
jgi:hypothetical protein